MFFYKILTFFILISFRGNVKEVKEEIQVQEAKRGWNSGEGFLCRKMKMEKFNKPFYGKLSKYTMFISKLPIEIVV